MLHSSSINVSKMVSIVAYIQYNISVSRAYNWAAFIKKVKKKNLCDEFVPLL